MTILDTIKAELNEHYTIVGLSMLTDNTVYAITLYNDEDCNRIPPRCTIWELCDDGRVMSNHKHTRVELNCRGGKYTVTHSSGECATMDDYTDLISMLNCANQAAHALNTNSL